VHGYYYHVAIRSTLFYTFPRFLGKDISHVHWGHQTLPSLVEGCGRQTMQDPCPVSCKIADSAIMHAQRVGIKNDCGLHAPGVLPSSKLRANVHQHHRRGIPEILVHAAMWLVFTWRDWGIHPRPSQLLHLLQNHELEVFRIAEEVTCTTQPSRSCPYHRHPLHCMRDIAYLVKGFWCGDFFRRLYSYSNSYSAQPATG
jgi:hypothetical protein